MKRYIVWTLADFIFIALLGFSSIGLAEVDIWTRKADMPTARYNLSTSVINGKIYAIGGAGGPSIMEEYDPTMDKWAKKTDLPTAIFFQLSTSLVNGKIYAIGGGSRGVILSTVEKYDPVTDTWTKKADMPNAARGFLSTSAVNGKIYAIGGEDGRQQVLSIVEEYDPTTDKWTKKADMPTARLDLSTSVVNGKIYAIGGSTTGFVALSTAEEYDPVKDKWTKKADMPTARLDLSTSVVNGKIYAIGGWRQGRDLSTVEEYDPLTDKWTKKADMPTARRALSTSAIHGKIYAIGGGQGIPLARLSTVEEYDIVGVRVTRISPQEGKVTGGEPIAIFGSGFRPGLNVTIGGKPLVELKVTDILITGATPPGTEGEQNILITIPGFSDPIFEGKFIYRPLSNIIITSITPTNGKQAGGDKGSITGIGFLQGATVMIGNTLAADVVVAPTLILFTIPPGTEGTKNVIVTNPDGQKGILRGGYTYNPLPIIEKIKPNGGSLSGGTGITVTGINFMPGAVIMIGDRQIGRIDFFSPTELRFQTPSGTVGPKDVRVINPDGQEAVLKDGFTYNPAPTISSIESTAGPIEGGTEIIINGIGFLDGADVVIEGVEVSRRIVSSTKIIAKTRSSTAGAKDVVVLNPDGQEAILKNAFTYNLAPQITKIIPNNGPLSGGTKIAIQGSGFIKGGVPIGVVGQEGSNEVRWQDSRVHVGLYVYLMEVKVGGQVKRFKRMLEVYK